MVKHLPTVRETRFQSLGREDLLERAVAPTPAFLPGKSHGQSGVAGYSPFPSLGNLPDPGGEPQLLASPALAA